MQSGRVLPSFRQIFSTLKTGNSNRDSNSQGGNSGGSPERDATDEEAKQAAEILSASDEFSRNGLKVTSGFQSGKFILMVNDARGNLLRVITSTEIVKILAGASTPDSPRQGRILDRRI